MADPGDTARQWLAGLLSGTSVGIKIGPTGMMLAVEDIADAILSAPGVEVGTERYRDPGDPAEVHSGVVIRLPPKPAQRYSCLDPKCPGEHPSVAGVCWPGDPYHARRTP